MSGGISLEGKGIGSTADILVFALLLSIAIAILPAFSSAGAGAESERHASSLAQSTLLSLQCATAEQLGGFEYKLDAFGFDLGPTLFGDSARRELRHKTLCQLLAETAALNLRVEVAGADAALSRPNAAMETGLRVLLKDFLGQAVDGIFGYRLLALAEPVDLGFARIFFEMEVASLSEAKSQLCVESVALSLPISEGGLTMALNACGIYPLGAFDVDPLMEVRLELWSL